MPRLRCPRCANVIEVAPGVAPACPACGFGSAARASAPMVARPAPAAPPRAASPPPAAPLPAPRRGRTGLVAATAIVAVLLIAGLATAGWFLLRGGEASPLSEAEAESRVAAALQAVPGSIAGDAAADDLREVTMEMEPAQRTPAGPEDFFGAFGKMEVTTEYGRDGVVRFDLDMASGAITVAFTMICTPTQTFMLAGGETYGSRPRAAPDADACSAMDGSDGMFPFFGEGLGGEGEGLEPAEGDGVDGPFSPLEAMQAEDADITRRGDGTVKAELDQDGAHVTLELDAQGRMRSLVAETPEGTFTITHRYGDRSVIALPGDYDLLPAEVEVDSVTDGAVQTWTVESSPQEPPLADFEVRLQDWGSSFGFDEDQGPEDRLATFTLTSAPQTQGNFTFRFNDADGDGKLTAGDSYSVEDLEQAAEDAAAAAEEGNATEDDPFDFDFDFDFPTHEAVLYDVHADGAVNSTPMEMPAPPAAWLAVAVLALALALRRRRA